MLLTTGDIKFNLQIQEDQLEYSKVYKEEEPEKCEYCINKIAGLQNSVNTLNEKIISASYWYGLQGNYPTHTKKIYEKEEEFWVDSKDTIIKKSIKFILCIGPKYTWDKNNLQKLSNWCWILCRTWNNNEK